MSTYLAMFHFASFALHGVAMFSNFMHTMSGAGAEISGHIMKLMSGAGASIS